MSRTDGRDGDTFWSTDEQAQKIRESCKAQGLRLIEAPFEEKDVSGGAALEDRPGLLRALELVEAGRADVVVVAYLDRLVRSVQVQAEAVSRVEAAGGEIIALDVGKVTNGNAAAWLNVTNLGAFAEYQRRSVAERTHEAKRRAIARGVPPYPNVPPGYRKLENGGLEIDPAAAPAVAEAFRLRARGATVSDVRDHLRAAGIVRSLHGVTSLLRSRVYLGELRFGSFEPNLAAWPALIDAATFARVQQASSPRGPRPKSDHLLARLGILRCAACDSRMTVGSSCPNGKATYHFYRCNPAAQDCPQRVTIGGRLADEAIEAETRRLLDGMKGKAAAGNEAQAAAATLDRCQADLDATMRTFVASGVADEPAAVTRLSELRDARNTAADKVNELADIADASHLIVDPDRDWRLFTLTERRALIRAVLAKVTVAPGRGVGRLTFEPRNQ